MERHLASCAACAAFARDLERIGDVVRAPIEPATPLEHQRARLSLLRKAMDPAAAAPPSWWSAPRFVLAATALAAAVALGWLGAGLGARPSHPEVALHLRVRPLLASARETTLRPSDDARFERKASAGLDVVTLTSGTLDVTVKPLPPGQRFVVRTSDAEVEVRGTAFRVEASDGKIRGVSVAEGAVEVRYAGFSAVIPSGGSWRATNDGPRAEPSAAAPVAAPAVEPVGAPVVSGAHASQSSAGTSGRVASRSSVAPVRREPKPPIAAAAPPVEEPPPAPAPTAEPAARPAPAPTTSPASSAFADAMTLLRRGDYAGSAAKLDGFASSFPADARADEADYLRAIALQRAGRSADAAAAAKRYLASRPHGAHRAEAKQIAKE